MSDLLDLEFQTVVSHVTVGTRSRLFSLSHEVFSKIFLKEIKSNYIWTHRMYAL